MGLRIGQDLSSLSLGGLYGLGSLDLSGLQDLSGLGLGILQSLGVGGRGLSGTLTLAVFFQLSGQNTELALQQSVLLVESDVIFGQRFQEFVHLLHIVAAEGRLFKGNLVDLLGSNHICFSFRYLCVVGDQM